MLDVPLATHGFTARFPSFGIEQVPFSTSSRLGSNSRVVLPEASFQVGRPADIGSARIIRAFDFPAHKRKRIISYFGGRLTMDKFHFVPERKLANGRGRSHSPSFDQRRRPETLRTAMATAFFCPTSTTSRLPRVTPV